MKKKLFIDFDGVLNPYDNWQSNSDRFKPLPGTKEFLKKLGENYEIYVFTTKDKEEVYKWLIRYFLDDYIRDVTNQKESADLYIKDRVIKFGL